jgi:hypothetical protein
MLVKLLGDGLTRNMFDFSPLRRAWTEYLERKSGEERGQSAWRGIVSNR